MTFLEDMYQLMQAAHFRLLSADDWKTAQAEQFTVRLWQHLTHGSIVIYALSGIRISLGRVIHLLYSFFWSLHQGAVLLLVIAWVCKPEWICRMECLTYQQ